MRRNTIAIIGSAGPLDEKIRKKVEELTYVLCKEGFDIVTGGLDGIMRAVSRGHFLSPIKTNLTHILPGWGRDWELNPHPANIIRTDTGSIRNHFVVRSADLVIAISGGSGTLSELAIAWQEKKPIAVLFGFGGWSDKLSNEILDHRRVKPIEKCTSISEIINWANLQRPEGVFKGRLNQGYYPHEVPALHRIYVGSAKGVQKIHKKYGMSIELNDLKTRLKKLNETVGIWNKKYYTNSVCLVTFDDGWKDVLLLEDIFSQLSNLCPVLFLGENHFSKNIKPLPLQRFYEYCSKNNIDPEDRKKIGISRGELKDLSEKEQHEFLDNIGISEMLNPEWLLNESDIKKLKESGWVVASHGFSHENLGKHEDLKKSIEILVEKIEKRTHMPWLAWPEGRWTKESLILARESGIHLQFGLKEEPHEEPLLGMVLRKIWC